jgi:hypothetical protein
MQNDYEEEIVRLRNLNQKKITDVEVQHAQELQIKAVQEEKKYLQKSLLLDSILSDRAEIQILTDEIERSLITSAVRTLDAETQAISGCLKNSSKEIDAHIHPFQQFAVALYDKCDKNSHLDAVNKCAQIQTFITRLKNRGTEVETLTSGTGFVFTLKDINDCVCSLAKGIIKYGEQELRSRVEAQSKSEEMYKEMLYFKDQKIDALQQRLDRQNEIIDKTVNSRMYEKGNQLVYELDQANRSLKLMKDNIFTLEAKIRAEVGSEFKNKLDHREMVLYKELKKFGQFKNDLVTSVQAGFVNE